MTQQISLIQGQLCGKEEGDSVEFKDITSRKPVKTIVNHAEEYIVGFLNAQVEGDLYLGIDDCGIIQGVNLSLSDRDQIGRDIPNKLRNTDPPIHPKDYKVAIDEVFNDDNKRIEGLYVVSIHVNAVETVEEKLYRTEGGSVYRKEGSSCRKLSLQEIEEEVRRRTQRSLKKEADDLDKKLLKDPNNDEYLEKRAKIAQHMGDIDTVVQIYEKRLSLNPKNRRARIQYSFARQDIDDWEGALSILSEVEDETLSKYKGPVLFRLERWAEAYKSYKTILEANPNDYCSATQIGIILRQQGKYPESIKFFNYALSKAPNYRLAKYEKKKTYYELFKGGFRNKDNIQ